MSKPLSLAVALTLALTAPAAAQTYMGTYTAWIGQQDLYNSNGVRLTEPWQIIRQDRANYHRFNRRDAGDAGDAWFHNADARAALEQAVMNYGLDPASRQMILQGGAWVQVDLYGYGNRVRQVAVAAYR
jgi:hypothetical protein